MPSSKHTSAADTSNAVDTFIASLNQPKRTETELLRTAIVASAMTITEGIKWNAPSYKTHEYFATTNLRTKTGIGLILHFGAKARAVEASRENIADPTGLLKWLANDRAAIEFKNAEDIQSKRTALQAIVRQWVKFV